MPDPPLKRLLQLLGMTGSAHDGEALSALRIAQRHMRDCGISWEDLVTAGTDDAKKWTDGDLRAVIAQATEDGYRTGYKAAIADGKVPPPKPMLPTSYASFAKTMLEDFEDSLSEWEQEFCESWVSKSYPPTPKQLAVFQRLRDKTGVALP